MPDAAPAYTVLARKYRPETFADLIGQEAMVRTLRNAFAADRIHHAFVMTGIRGTGKTTTARIIAKGLNCIGPDGTGRPTTDPCGTCEHCRAISAGRHVDVLEMDAASRTGVGDIREIIESVAYRAASARYKVYIIDEVHMLSTNAFNALLKTLEEPPAHVKFIFATTEIRQVPVTVLSRCQRFDLRRIEPEVMIAHLEQIAAAEGAQVAADALALIVRAAEGSVRDAMSLLDQAISHGAGATDAEAVRMMLGLADRGRIIDLFERILRGDAAGALTEIAALYADGADPLAVLRDLAEITHWVSVLKVSPDAADDPTAADDERRRCQTLAGQLPMRSLARMWQMLLKAIEEVSVAPSAMMAAEMAVIRLTHVADLPSPEDLIRQLQGDGPAPDRPRGGPTGTARPHAAAPASAGGPSPTASGPAGNGGSTRSQSAKTAVAAPAFSAPLAQAAPVAALAGFDDVLDLIRQRRDMALLLAVETGLRLVRYAQGRIEFEPAPGSAPDLAARLSRALQDWTGLRWGVSVVTSGGAPTIAEQRAVTEARDAVEAASLPMVRAVLSAFPGARIMEVRNLPSNGDNTTPEEIAGSEADDASDMDEDWDPFEDD